MLSTDRIPRSFNIYKLYRVKKDVAIQKLFFDQQFSFVLFFLTIVFCIVTVAISVLVFNFWITVLNLIYRLEFKPWPQYL